MWTVEKKKTKIIVHNLQYISIVCNTFFLEVKSGQKTQILCFQQNSSPPPHQQHCVLLIESIKVNLVSYLLPDYPPTYSQLKDIRIISLMMRMICELVGGHMPCMYNMVTAAKHH